MLLLSLLLAIFLSSARTGRKEDKGAYARTKRPTSKHNTGANPIVSSNVAVVSRSDFPGFIDARPNDAPAIRNPARTKRGMMIGRHVYGDLTPCMRRMKTTAGMRGQ